MAFNYSYSFSSKAMQDLDEILHYMAFDLCSPQSAKNFLEKVYNKIDILRSFPESGAPVDNEFLSIAIELRKIIIDNYLLYYTLNKSENIIIIVRILYGKRNINEILRNL